MVPSSNGHSLVGQSCVYGLLVDEASPTEILQLSLIWNNTIPGNMSYFEVLLAASTSNWRKIETTPMKNNIKGQVALA